MTVHLSSMQKTVVEFNEGPLLVVAGPGAGKTRVLTERVRRLLTECDEHLRVLALTFTNKAASEMKDRLKEFPDINNKSFIGTFHGFCMEVLSNRGKQVGIEGTPNLIDKDQDRQQILYEAIGMDPELRMLLRNNSGLLRRWLDMIRHSKNNLIYPEMVEKEIDRKVYELYNARLNSLGLLDYDDLLVKTCQLFQERPKIAGFYRRLYRYICIDEAQDLNEAQYNLLISFCGEEYRNVMLVGDPKQAIFEWNGASPRYLERFEREYNALKIELKENYRSAEVIVNAAKSLFPDYQVEGNLAIHGQTKLFVANNEEDEASIVCDEIDKLLCYGHGDIEGPVTLDRIAILGRNRYVFGSIEKQLSKRGLSFYTLTSNEECESEFVDSFILCVKLVANRNNVIHLQRICSRWGLEVRDVHRFCNKNTTVSGLFELIKDKVSERGRVILDAVTIIESSNNPNRVVEALDKLDEFAKTLDNIEERALIMQDTMVWRGHWDAYVRSNPVSTHSIGAFLGQVALGTTRQMKQEGIALLTIHTSKGLEFDVVFLIGMTEGTFPDYRATGKALEEEKRNLFVSITRSKRLLYFSYPKYKLMPWGESKYQFKSSLLRYID